MKTRPSHVSCLDIMAMTERDVPDYDTLWCDPPWGDGLVKMFHTMMRKAGANPPGHTFEQVVQKLGYVASTKKRLVVETDVRTEPKFREILARCGHHIHSAERRTQTNGNPYVILVFNRATKVPQGKGFDVLTRFVRSETAALGRPVVIFDPFAGIGKSACAVIKAGGVYHGYELNPARAIKASAAVGRLLDAP